MSDYIITYTKEHFSPLEPDEYKIKLEDIAHALSMMTRANGHFPEFYSVAQHCLDCEKEAEEEKSSSRIRLACLLHDGSEAYISDITRPVKKELKRYLSIEKKLQDTIYRRFIPGGISAEENAAVCRIDDAMLYYEFMHFVGEEVITPKPEIKRIPDFISRPMKEIETEYLETAKKLLEN